MTPMQHAQERQQFAAECLLIEELRETLAAARAATDASAAAALFLDLAGYESPETDLEALREAVAEHVRDVCYDAGVPVSLVGLTEEA